MFSKLCRVVCDVGIGQHPLHTVVRRLMCCVSALLSWWEDRETKPWPSSRCGGQYQELVAEFTKRSRSVELEQYQVEDQRVQHIALWMRED